MQLRKMYINRVRRNKNDSKLYKVQNQDVTLNRLGSLSDRKMKITNRYGIIEVRYL